MFHLAKILKGVLLGTKTKSLPDVITCDTQDIPHLAEAGALFRSLSVYK